MYELIVIWEDGDKEVHGYTTEEEAQERARGFKMAFGNQIQWCGVRRKLN